jgi:hypothetical protein
LKNSLEEVFRARKGPLSFVADQEPPLQEMHPESHKQAEESQKEQETVK